MMFKDNLRAARERMGLTQQQVADAMEISKSAYCGYETGKRHPDVHKIRQLSQILEITADELLNTGQSAPQSDERPTAIAYMADGNAIPTDVLSDMQNASNAIEDSIIDEKLHAIDFIRDNTFDLAQIQLINRLIRTVKGDSD